MRKKSTVVPTFFDIKGKSHLVKVLYAKWFTYQMPMNVAEIFQDISSSMSMEYSSRTL